MKRLFLPSKLILYILTILVFDLIGMSIAGIKGVVKDQGLAGGAIVFKYGVYAAVAAFITALIFCYNTEPPKIKIANRILAVILLLLIAVLSLRIYLMKEVKDNAVRNSVMEAQIISVSTSVSKKNTGDENANSMGLGFFKPDLLSKSTLYFYEVQNIDKPVYEYSPEDSLVFRKTELSNYDSVHSPPWLLPEHYKLEYDIFYLKLISVGRNFVEVFVNDKMQKTSYLDRFAGEILYWPEFLLRVNSVELLSDTDQKIRIKPLENAGIVNIKYDILQPVLIMDEWMSVDLYDENYTKQGSGWIRWKDNNKLLINYYLLS